MMLKLYSDFFGGFKEHKEAAIVTVISLMIMGVYGYFQTIVTGTPPGAVELVATITSLACVWLTRTENLWAWPIGIVSVIFLGWLFFDAKIIGQAALQILFYLPIQFVGWYIWVYGGEGVNNLKVSLLSWGERISLAAASVLGFFIVASSIKSMYSDAVLIAWDTTIVVASIIAQACLSYKKIEAWYIWFLPVNVSMIGLCYVTGQFMIMALYGIYLINAGLAIFDWTKEYKALKTA